MLSFLVSSVLTLPLGQVLTQNLFHRASEHFLRTQSLLIGNIFLLFCFVIPSQLQGFFPTALEDILLNSRFIVYKWEKKVT